MAVWVDVKDGNVNQALGELNKRREEAGIPEELRRRRHYLNPSEQRFEDQKKAYKKAVGKVISERIRWAMARKSK